LACPHCPEIDIRAKTEGGERLNSHVSMLPGVHHYTCDAFRIAAQVFDHGGELNRFGSCAEDDGYFH
jgi:hypothetical protein